MISVLLICIGIVFIIAGIDGLIDKIRLLRNGIRIDGEIINFEKSNDPVTTDGNDIIYVTIYKPIIRYKTEEGDYRTFTYDSLQYEKLYKVGDKVKLICPYMEYENIEVDEKDNLIKSFCRLMAIGIMFIVFAIVLYLI